MIRIGSDEHKKLFCLDFVRSHVSFDPARLAWPELDNAALARLRAIPFWQEVLHTERRAGAIVDAYAATLTEPLLHQAMALQGLEEARHADLLQVMIERYRIDAEPHELEPIVGDPFEAFADFGYGECLDAFLGFGALGVVEQQQFDPSGLSRKHAEIDAAGQDRRA